MLRLVVHVVCTGL